MLVVYEAVELAAPVGADRHHERAAPHLLRQADRRRLVEFLRPVDGEAPGRAAEHMHQHRHLGRIGAEMRMQVLDAGRAQPRLDAAGLGQIDEMHGQRTLGAAAHAPGQRQRPQQPHRPREQHARHGEQQRQRPVAQDIARALALALVFGVDQLAVPAAQRDAHRSRSPAAPAPGFRAG